LLILCWSAKGGSGTTVVAAGLALAHPGPTLLVDLDGDLPATLGIGEPDLPGVHDWLTANAPAERLAKLEIPLTERAHLLAAGTPAPAGPGRWEALARHFADDPRHVVVDIGTHHPPPALAAAAEHIFVVTRNCYLALRAFVRRPGPATGVIVVEERGRSYRADDIEHALGVPVAATVLHDPAVARAADAGLMLGRVPGALRHALAA